jgi:hypothetical protein
VTVSPNPTGLDVVDVVSEKTKLKKGNTDVRYELGECGCGIYCWRV